ncbi:MAG: YIP1 family protein, partial [archaeon]|nr:YIP1 family protein [archaeon]
VKKMIDLWIKAITKPQETFNAEKKNANLGIGIVNYAIAGLISGILAFLLFGIIGAIFGGSLEAVAPGVLSIATTPIFQVIGALIIAGLFFIVAKVLGGKGSFSQIFYLASLYAVPIALVSWIPFVGWLASIYALYLLYLVIKISQGLSTGRAILTILIPIVILFIIATILAVIVGVAVLSAFGSLPTTGLFGL